MSYSDYTLTIVCNNSLRVVCRECDSFYDGDSDEFHTADEFLYYATDVIVHSEQCHSGDHQDDYFDWCDKCMEELDDREHNDPWADHVATEMAAIRRNSN